MVNRLFDFDAAVNREGQSGDLQPGEWQAGRSQPPDRAEQPLTVSEFYRRVDGAITAAFPSGLDLWVQGEIHSVADYSGKSGHLYMDVIDPGVSGSGAPVLRVVCWKSVWMLLRERLVRAGIDLQEGMSVRLRGDVALYRARGQVQFAVRELDLESLLGKLELQRRRLIAALESEGLLEKNRSLPRPAVPLCVGLVASPGTEGYNDFMGQLGASGLSFRVYVVPTVVQGAQAPGAIVKSLEELERRSGEVDICVIVRGGGARADLMAFDAEPVARRIVGMSVPVWTGIGHTGDESVADLVAASAYATPTRCGAALVETVSSYVQHAMSRAGVIAGSAAIYLGEASRSRDHMSRRLADLCSRHIDQARGDLVRRSESIGVRSQAHADRAADRVALFARLAAGGFVRAVERGSERVEAVQRLVTSHDPRRQLARGYSLTSVVDPGAPFGRRLLRSAQDCAAGTTLLTEFADGVMRSVADGLHKASDGIASSLDDGSNGAGEPDKRKPGRRLANR